MAENPEPETATTTTASPTEPEAPVEYPVSLDPASGDYPRIFPEAVTLQFPEGGALTVDGGGDEGVTAQDVLQGLNIIALVFVGVLTALLARRSHTDSRRFAALAHERQLLGDVLAELQSLLRATGRFAFDLEVQRGLRLLEQDAKNHGIDLPAVDEVDAALEAARQEAAEPEDHTDAPEVATDTIDRDLAQLGAELQEMKARLAASQRPEVSEFEARLIDLQSLVVQIPGEEQRGAAQRALSAGLEAISALRKSGDYATVWGAETDDDEGVDAEARQGLMIEFSQATQTAALVLGTRIREIYNLEVS